MLLHGVTDQTASNVGRRQVGATSALPKIITTGFRAVHLIYFFTAGADEVKCWQIRKQTKAPAGVPRVGADVA